jgi:hypothetical protein
MLLPGLGLILGLGPEEMPAERKDREIMTLRTGSLCQQERKDNR